MSHITNIKGTKDILPDENVLWKETINLIHNFMSLHGYGLLDTPVFEKTDLFCRSIGENTDIVSKEMYTWEDRDGTSLTLRPELTAPVIRSYIQNNLGAQSPINRIYYIGSSFRRERPQKGRQRQFTQYGIEAIGSANAEQDAEVILIAYKIYEMLGIENLVVTLNSIGSSEAKSNYTNNLIEYLNPFKNELSETSQVRLNSNPLRILDSKSENDKKILESAPKIIDSLRKDDLTHFEQVQNHLSNLGVQYKIDDRLVRGLDYYNRTTFEITSQNIGSQDALCGGGRYDGLIKQLGGKNTPAVGFAAGMERLMLVLNQLGEQENHAGCVDIYIISIGEDAISKSLTIANDIRSELGIRVMTDTLNRSIKAQMREANKNMAQFVIIIGEDEIKKGKAIIKNMSDGTQTESDFNQVIKKFGVEYYNK